MTKMVFRLWILRGSTISLVDVNPEALQFMAQVARRLNDVDRLGTRHRSQNRSL